MLFLIGMETNYIYIVFKTIFKTMYFLLWVDLHLCFGLICISLGYEMGIICIAVDIIFADYLLLSDICSHIPKIISIFDMFLDVVDR